MRILVVGAHFDDAEIGIGGTLLKHAAAKDEIFIAVLNADEKRTGDPKIREKEQIHSLDLIGFFAEENLFTYNSGEEPAFVIEEHDYIKPDRLYIPWRYDSHQDHVRASMIGEAVSRKRSIDYFYYDSCSARNFVPNAFVPIIWVEKYQLLKCFPSQNLDHERIRKRDVYWGSLIDQNHAEGLIVGRCILPVSFP